MLVRKTIAVLLTTLTLGCGAKNESSPQNQTSAPAPAAPAPGETPLTAFELEHGIGPVKEVVTLGPLNAQLAAAGKTVFEAKCAACHKIGEKYVGPALGEVTTRRSPTFIMNMVLNPQEMVERHPIAKQLLAETMTNMANQGLSVDEARSVVEYLRTQAKGTVKTQ
jgi:mono/diheme cytochrome c family protein